jgi:ribonuclease BN (tRNA processing enzyme)
MKDMHHSSLIIESGGAIYWFDAGDSCIHTAYTMGLNVSNSRALFISHPHIDHTGGIANMLHCFSKLVKRYNMPLTFNNTFDIYTPSKKVVDAAKLLASYPSIDKFPFTLNTVKISDGVIYSDENLKITAIHNTHLGESGERGWHAYSFLIECEGMRIVHSGDVGKPCELDPFMAGGCDLFLMETGHHAVKDVCAYAISKRVKALRFIHHGREILENRDGAEKYVAALSEEYPIDISITSDGTTERF